MSDNISPELAAKIEAMVERASAPAAIRVGAKTYSIPVRFVGAARNLTAARRSRVNVGRNLSHIAEQRRELAAELGIDYTTATRVWQELANEVKYGRI